IGIGRGHQPIGYQIFGGLHHFSSNLVEYLPFIWNAFGHNHIESRKPIGGYHNQYIVINVIDFPYFTFVNTFLAWKIEVGICNGVHLKQWFYMICKCNLFTDAKQKRRNKLSPFLIQNMYLLVHFCDTTNKVLDTKYLIPRYFYSN